LTKVNMVTADQHLTGKFDTGSVNHQMLLGFDIAYARQERQSGFDAPVYAGGGVTLIDAYNPVYGNFTPPAMSDDPTSRQRDTGFYLQDQMKFGQNWIVVAGLRYDRSVSSVEQD